MHLVATKSFKYPRGSRYRTRRLTAGDPFKAESDADARLLLQAKKATVAPQKVAAAPVAENQVEVDRLRARAESLGVEVDKRWGIKRLQAEIDAKRAPPNLMV